MTVFGNDSFVMPESLRTDDFLIRPLLGSDTELDYVAVMESREFLRKWEQSTWPADDFTVAGNREDLERHEREHIAREAFTYTVMNLTETECLGCIYIYPTTARWLSTAEVTAIGDTAWADVEAVTLFWIRQSRLAEGLDRTLLDALRPWAADEWSFDGHAFLTNEQFEQQVAMLEAAGLHRHFDVKLPKAPGTFVAYS